MPGEGDRQDLPEINGSNHIAGDNADSSSQNNRQPSVLDEESESEEEESTSVIELSPYAVAMGLLISGQTLFWRAQGANGVEAVLLYKQAIRNFKLVLQTHDMFSEQVLNQLRSKLALSFIKVGEYLFGQARVERLCEREIRLYAQSETQYREALKQFGMLMRSYEGKNEEKAETAWINHACTRLSIGLTLNGRASSGEDDTKLQLYEDAIREFKAAETEYRTLGLTGTERYRREISFGIMRALLYASSASLKKQMLSVKDLEQKSRICDELMKKVDAAEAEYRNAITENYVGSVGETKVMFVRLDFAGQFKKLGYEFLQALDTADMEQKIHLCEQAITNFQQAEKWYRVLAAWCERHDDSWGLEDVRFELCYVLRDSSLVLFSQAENTKNDLEQEISLCDHAVKYFNEFVDIAVRQVDEFWPTISIPKFFLVASKLYKRGCDREVPIEQAAGFLTLAEQLYRGAVHIYERFGNNKLKVSLFNLGVTIARRAVTKDCDEARGRYSKAEIRILYEQAIGYLMRSATLCMSLNGADDAERVTKEFLELPDVEGDKKPEDKSKIEGLEVITDIKEEPKIVDKEPKIGIEGPEIMDIEGFKRVRRALATTFYELGLVLLEQAQRAGNEEQMIDLFERSAERLSTAERMFLILHNEERAYHTNEHYLAPVLQRSSSLLLNRAERSQYFDEAIQLFEQAAKRFDELGLVLIRQARYASEGAKKAELYKQAEENFGRTAETYDTVIARCETYQDEKLNNRVQRDRLQSRITWGCALREHAEVVSDIDEQVALYRNAEEVLGTTLNELNKFKGEDDEIGDDLQATSAVYTDVLFKLGELLQKQAENAKTAEEKAELERQAEEYRLRADDFIRKFMGGEEQSQTSGQDIEKTVPEVDEPPPSPGMF